VAKRGGTVLLCAPAGEDFRPLLEEQLGFLGVRLVLTPTRLPTRSCVTVLEDDGRATEFVQEALPLEEDEAARFISDALRCIDGASAVLLAGTLPPGLTPEFYARCARRAADRDLPLVIDAQRDALLAALPHGAAIVKINRQEFHSLQPLLDDSVNGDASIIYGGNTNACNDNTIAAALLKRGAHCVVVSDGGDPVRVWTGEGMRAFPVPEVRAINPVGSGDAMSGGITAALSAGASLEAAIAEGIALGVANVQSLLPGDV
jgi:fructose-1-phosphate kinase PfkB-like protein